MAIFFGKFYFQDFFSYQLERDGPIKSSAIDYLDEHMDIAMKGHDFDYILACLKAKSDIYRYHRDCDGYLDFQMKMFVFLINPFILVDSDFKTPYSIDGAYIIEFKKLTKFFEEERIYESFDENWNFLNLESEAVSRSDARTVLEKILNKERTDDILKYVKSNLFNGNLEKEDKTVKRDETLDKYF